MNMQYLIVLVFLINFFAFNNGGYFIGSSLSTHFSYIFCHANGFHLFFNSLAFIGIYRAMRFKYVVITFFIAVVASFFAQYTIPTVGASGWIYAMFGVYSGFLIKGIVTKNKLAFFLSVGLMFTVSVFKHNSNWILHLISYSLGLIYLFISYEFNRSR